MTSEKRKQLPVRLREMFNENYKLITILPSWSYFTYKDDVGEALDDILFARCKDLLVDPERYLIILDSWIIDKRPALERVYEALVNNDYDPLANYDMIEMEGLISKEGTKTTAAKKYGTDLVYTSIPHTKSSRYSTTFDNAAEGRLESYTESEALSDNISYDSKPAQVTASEQTADSQDRQGTEMTEEFAGDVEIAGPESTLEGDKGEQRELSRKGNIGVTTSQQLLQSELDLRAKYSFMNFFCDLFAREMTLGVYAI